MVGFTYTVMNSWTVVVEFLNKSHFYTSHTIMTMPSMSWLSSFAIYTNKLTSVGFVILKQS